MTADESMPTEAVTALSGKLGSAASGALLMTLLYSADRFKFIPRLAELGKPATASKIAEALQLTERYVRELCNAFVCHDILRYDADAKTYAVPEATAIVLGGKINKASFDGIPQAIHSLHDVADEVAESIQGHTKGVPFTRYKGIIEAIKRMNLPAIVTGEIFTWTAPLQSQLEQGTSWVDIGCGSGQFVLQLANRYPKSRFLGIDLSQESIEACNKSLAACDPPLKNASFKNTPIEALGQLEGGDIGVLSTFDVIHDVPFATQALKAIYDTLKPGGQYFMVEPRCSSNVLDNVGPRGGFLYSISLLHCLTQNLANDGEGLGACWGYQKQEAMLREAGFTEIQRLELDNETQIFWLCCK